MTVGWWLREAIKSFWIHANYIAPFISLRIPKGVTSLNNMRPGEPGERVAPAHPGKTVKRMFRYLSKSRGVIIWMLLLLA